MVVKVEPAKFPVVPDAAVAPFNDAAMVPVVLKAPEMEPATL